MSFFSSVKYVLRNIVSMTPEPRTSSLYAASKPYFVKITRTTDKRNNICFYSKSRKWV